MRDINVYSKDSEDSGARTAYHVESLRELTDAEFTAAIGDQTLPRERSNTKRHGMDYTFVKIFVPVRWPGFQQPKAEPGVCKLGM